MAYLPLQEQFSQLVSIWRGWFGILNDLNLQLRLNICGQQGAHILLSIFDNGRLLGGQVRIGTLEKETGLPPVTGAKFVSEWEMSIYHGEDGLGQSAFKVGAVFRLLTSPAMVILMFILLKTRLIITANSVQGSGQDRIRVGIYCRQPLSSIYVGWQILGNIVSLPSLPFRPRPVTMSSLHTY